MKKKPVTEALAAARPHLEERQLNALERACAAALEAESAPATVTLFLVDDSAKHTLGEILLEEVQSVTIRVAGRWYTLSSGDSVTFRVGLFPRLS